MTCYLPAFNAEGLVEAAIQDGWLAVQTGQWVYRRILPDQGRHRQLGRVVTWRGQGGLIVWQHRHESHQDFQQRFRRLCRRWFRPLRLPDHPHGPIMPRAAQGLRPNGVRPPRRISIARSRTIPRAKADDRTLPLPFHRPAWPASTRALRVELDSTLPLAALRALYAPRPTERDALH